MMESWKRLQNGTDIRGIAIETPQNAVTLTSAMVRAIGSGFRQWLLEKKNIQAASCKIPIAMDSR